MRIAFFGSSLVSSYWNGAATYYRGLLREIAARGHAITFYEPDAFDRQRHRDIPDPDWARVVVYPATEDGWRSSLADAVHTADLIAKASGVGVFDRDLEIAVPESTRAGTITVYWDVDAPATLEAIAADHNHHLRRMVPRYDLVLTYGGGDPVVREYERVGARCCVPIYNAVDPRTHHPAARQSEYACDLSFLGNRLPDREARVAEFLVKVARRLPDRAFLLGGAGWRTEDMPTNVRVAGHVGSAAHNAFYCSGTATLNVNRGSMARYGFSPPTRIFEAAGAGACIITDEWDGIGTFLDPETEILVAGDGDRVADIVGALDDSAARLIGRAAMRRVLAEHTYSHRARQVLKLLSAASSKSEAAE
jgi:spore maturation protein CgeB